ncbi:kinase-like domain-containing protein [Rhizophagus irregularis DAOM 181602=DAOM 197198]|nr:kinase-like domain-containing protein [Rhizophagus irregularis DAOM 181602=DAOM 197198]
MDSFGLIKLSDASEICKKCNCICYSIQFQHNFKNWTSGNDNIDKIIQNTQLSVHEDVSKVLEVLEWIPYDKLYNITKDDEFEFVNKIKFEQFVNEIKFEHEFYGITQDPETKNYMMSLNTSNILTLEFVNEIKFEHEFYGITQDPETKNYMMSLNTSNILTLEFVNEIKIEHEFYGITWDPETKNYMMLSVHKVAREALEWIPYDRFHDIKYIAEDDFGKVYRANWIDGYISYDENDKSWDNVNQNWRRNNLNMFVNLKSLNTPNDLTFELANKIKIEHTFYGITQDPETKNYMMIVLNNKCKEYTQLSAHKDVKEALEWIPYNRFYDIKYIAKGGFGKVYRAYLTNGFITDWDSKNQKWKRNSNDILVALKSLNNSKNITPEFINEFILHNKVGMDNFVIVGFYGITQDPETKNYIMILDYAEDGSLRNYLDKEYNANPSERPITKEINNILRRWHNGSNEELQAQIKEADEINSNSLNNITSNLGIYNTHSEASYTSRLLDFSNLPEPKNSDDYYEQNDNIISKEYSESLQLNFSQMNINTSESLQINISQLNINENESLQINISQLNINENESCQINISQLNINKNESSQINISRLNDNEDSQNSESGSKGKNFFLSQNNESESERKKDGIE